MLADNTQLIVVWGFCQWDMAKFFGVQDQTLPRPAYGLILYQLAIPVHLDLGVLSYRH